MRLGCFFFVTALFVGVLGASAPCREARGEEEAPKEEKPWCAPELETLADDVCFYRGPEPEGRRTLVIFLHGLVKDGEGWQHNQQRGLARGGKRLGFSVIAPRGVLGGSAKYGEDMIAWPTSPAAQEKYEAELIAQWTRARATIEERDGKPFDEVFVVGFSNGAYYASSLVMRAPIEVDGYAVFAGGSAYEPATSKRKPIYVGVSLKDSTAKDAQSLVKKLKKAKWPHKSQSKRVGHAIADAMLDQALAYLRAQRR